jgi:hypothetical protein
MHELSAGNATTGTTHEVAMGLPAPTPQSVGDAPPHATPFPQELAPQRLDEYRCALVAEFQPVGPSERVLVEKLAQLMAASDCWAAGEFATAREALRVAPTLLPPAATSEDAHWARAMNCDGTERCSRQFLGHVKGLQGTIKLLCDLQAQRRQRDAVPARPGPQLFVAAIPFRCAGLHGVWRGARLLCPVARRLGVRPVRPAVQSARGHGHGALRTAAR